MIGFIRRSLISESASAKSAPLLIASLIAVSQPALAGGNDAIAVGQVLVDANCSGCHATGHTGESPLSVAPKFRDLHLRYDVSLLGEALVEGIVTAHPDMPQFEFDAGQAEAIISYLKSLEK